MAEKEREKLKVESKPLTYLCRFDEYGRRGETRLSVDYTDKQKADMLANGYVEITQEEWEYYVGNKGTGDNGTGYIRDAKTGKPVSAPPHLLTKEEKLAQLEAEYEANKAELKGYLMDAILSDDNETVEELKQEMADIEKQYQLDRKELEG